MSCRVFLSNPNLYPLIPGVLPQAIKIKNASGHWQMSPGGTRLCPVETNCCSTMSSYRTELGFLHLLAIAGLGTMIEPS